MAKTPISSDKISYLKRIRSLFRKKESVPESGIPNTFQEMARKDLRFTMPDKVLPLFQKMVFSIKDEDTRVSVVDNLVRMTSPKMDEAQADYEREQLQFQIFKGITGRFYGELSHVDYTTHFVTHHNIQDTDFFRLVYIGIRSYECVSPEKREKFNKAIMSSVKRRGIAVPYRLQQYKR